MQILNNSLSIINNSLYKNQKICYIKKTKVTKKLLYCLINIGLIKEIQVKNNKYVIILTIQEVTPNTTVVKRIKNISKRAQQIYIPIYALVGLSWQNRRNIYLIVTNDGYIRTHTDCIKINKSGLLLASLYSN